MRALLLLLGSLFFTGPALASTLAVLPLGMGAGSEEFEGLGTGLAGMMIADLSQVDSLRLVERERLDDLMKEFTLTDSGFVDPSTAQRLGKGVGAELILTGDFSVVKDTIVMSTRIIRVETADVLKAVRASGAAADFVSVEKDLMEQLLEGLDVTLNSSMRRKLMIQTPTEDFTAFTDYGVGLKRSAEGKLEEAKAAYQKAVQADPEFAAAREALTSLRTMVESKRAERVSAKEAAKNAALLAAVELSPPPQDLKIRRITPVQLGELAARWAALDHLDRHCQRAEEMWTFGERSRWRVKTTGYKATAGAKVKGLIEAGRVRQQKEDPMVNPFIGDYAFWARNPFSSMDDYLWGVYGFIADEVKSGQGMLRFQQNCLGPAEQVAKLEALGAALEANKLADTRINGADGNLTIGIGLELHTLYVKAYHFGASPELFARAETLSNNAGADIEFFVTSRLTRVQKAAEGWERRSYQSFGMTDEEVMTDLQRLADGDVADLPRCAQLMTRFGGDNAADILKGLEDNKRRKLSGWDRIGVKASRHFGCLDGHPGDMETVTDAFGFVAAARTNLRSDRAEDPDCTEQFETLDGITIPEGKWFDDSLAHQMQSATRVLSTYYNGVVGNRCVEVPWHASSR